MVKKKRQYHIWQNNILDLQEDGDKLRLTISKDEAIMTSETFLYYILHEKIMGRSFDPDEEYEQNDEGIDVLIKKNLLPIISIETGRTRNKKTSKLLEKLLKDGFYLTDKNKNHFVFLDNVLSGSQNKECRQIYVLEKYYKKLKEYVSLGIEPTKCTVSKNLTRNALMTTDVYLVPIKMKKLGICIIPDCEVPVYETVNMVKPYERTLDETKKYKELEAYFETKKQYYALAKEARTLVSSSDCSLKSETKDNRNKDKYKTLNQWEDDGRRIKVDQLLEPCARFKIVNDEVRYTPLYSIEQTDELSEDDVRELPINEWSTGLQLVTEESHECIENVFDGMGLVSKRLGNVFKSHLGVPYNINGYQLRLPSVKGFFPCVDFHGYYEKHGISEIVDMWGEKHKIKEIDLLITESTFKAKLNVVLNKDGTEKKTWLFNSIDDYKERLIEYGYDAIGISNYAKPIEEEYRRATYQLWLALNIHKFDMLMFANIQGEMLHKVLSLYRKEEIDWDDVKYIQSFLRLIRSENPDSNLGKDCADTITALYLDKKMAFDRKVIRMIRDVIERKVDDMSLGRTYVKGKYMYVTQDIIALLRYAAAKNHDTWEYCGFLKEKECYVGEAIIGRAVLARNPIVSYSEITTVDFIKYDDEDSEFINHIDNIVQLPLGTEPDRLGGLDKDGDEVLVMPVDYFLNENEVKFLQNYNFIVDDESNKRHGKNLLSELNKEIKNSAIENIGKEKVTLEDFVIKSYVQVNDDDKAVAPSKEWCKENVIDFIMVSEDKTGQITDIDSTIENIGLAEGDVTKYALPIAIMKDLQGKMIDASKSGLFDQVIIPEVIRKKFDKRPLFMKYKGASEFKLDYKHESGLDFLGKRMEQYKSYVKRILVDDVNRKIKQQSFNNIYKSMLNPDLDGRIVRQVMDDLNDLYSRFISKNRDLAISRSKINKYSSDDRYKEQRERVDQKYKELYRETKEKAEEICSCPSLLATAAVRKTYIDTKSNNQNENYSFCWVVASEGILQNIKLNEDKEKVYIVDATEQDENSFEWLGEYFKVVNEFSEYDIDFEGKNMDIPDEYYRKEEELPDLENLKFTLMGVDKENTEIVADSIDGNSFFLFQNDKGWVCMLDDISIKEKEVVTSEYDLRSYIDKEITIKEILRAKNGQSVIQVLADIKG